MIIPKTLQELNNMITSQVMESIHLDYKESRALNGKPGEIAKDISAFANSDGGVVIYGVKEEQHYPVEIDQGINHFEKTREWLESIILSNITPIIDNIKIIQIPLSDTNSVYVIHVEQSVRAPHQERQNKRYYKRYNFSSVPMEDYEIRDIQSRTNIFSSLLNIDIEIDQGYFFELFIQNIGKAPAIDIKFNFPDNIQWENETPPQPLVNGIKALQPGKKLAFSYCESHNAYSSDSNILRTFTVEASYFHPEAGRRVTETFHLDIENLLGTSVSYDEIYYFRKDMKEELGKITSELQKLNSHLEVLQKIAGPTGLNLSANAIRNLANSFGAEPKLMQYNPQSCSRNQIEEILGVDRKMAYKLHMFFRYTQEGKIEDIEGMNDEIMNKIRKHFISFDKNTD